MNDEFLSSGISCDVPDGFRILGVFKRGADSIRRESAFFAGYRILFVTEGDGSISLGAEQIPIRPRDTVLIPMCQRRLCIEGEALKYLCVHFTGSEAKELASRLGFSDTAVVFHESELQKRDTDALYELSGEAMQLRAKALVYYVLSELSCHERGAFPASQPPSAAEKIKAYIDGHFSLPELSLKSIGDALSYHPNYISKAFCEHYRMSITKYVNVLRVRHARFMMEEGEDSMKLVAAECGFSDAEYFSSVFKAHYGQSPKEYCKRIRSIGTAPD